MTGTIIIILMKLNLSQTKNVMSIDIDWQTLTTGPEGLALAESIKAFVHDKFQQVELPRFIRSVQVHSFDFGKECPVVQLKDICDPLPEFYADDDDDDDDDETDGDGPEEDQADQSRQSGESLGRTEEAHRPINTNGYPHHPSPLPSTSRPGFIETRPAGLRPNLGLTDHISTPFLSRSNTPGIPGGTSNLSYFHLPLGAGMSGSQTPLAAVAGGTPYSAHWDHHGVSSDLQPRDRLHHPEFSYPDPSSRPSTAESYQESHAHTETQNIPDAFESTSCGKTVIPDPMDTQIVLHTSYSGTVRLSITAEILLDYPMPSFVGIPLKLNITGLSFDGVALIAYLRKRAHFCFLSPDDAQALVGVEGHNYDGGHTRQGGRDSNAENDRLGGLLREIRVESEIGRKEGGKQVLKNVGKVEKFVLEQVRRIFEDEFVWPSFWTFLL